MYFCNLSQTAHLIQRDIATINESLHDGNAIKAYHHNKNQSLIRTHGTRSASSPDLHTFAVLNGMPHKILE